MENTDTLYRQELINGIKSVARQKYLSNGDNPRSTLYLQGNIFIDKDRFPVRISIDYIEKSGDIEFIFENEVKKMARDLPMDTLEMMYHHLLRLNVFNRIESIATEECFKKFTFMGDPIVISGVSKEVIGRIGLVQQESGLVDIMYFGLDNKYTVISSLRVEEPSLLMASISDLSDIASVLAVITEQLTKLYEKNIGNDDNSVDISQNNS